MENKNQENKNRLIHLIKSLLGNITGICFTSLVVYVKAWMLLGAGFDSYLYKKSGIAIILKIILIIATFPFRLRYQIEGKKENYNEFKLTNIVFF